MKTGCLFIGCLCILAFAVMPAQAFTSKTLSITLDEYGNAQVDYEYKLTFVEQAAVFVNIANPADELKAALENHFHREVTVTKADSSSVQVNIPSFAAIRKYDGQPAMMTPAFSFARAENELRRYWFAPLITPDLSPDVTTITFPDGYQVRFDNQISFPTVWHVLE
ncbi:MAG TPA: hypothetical protein PKM50_02120 [Methanoregula sp.]|nr:hypothetical protein [Methanoregula sp.]